jgi:hypothetical protein
MKPEKEVKMTKHMRRKFRSETLRKRYGSPYAPGPDYDFEDEYAVPQDYGRNRHGSPYAPGPAWDWDTDYDRSASYGRNRYGSPYAPGPAYDYDHEADRPGDYGQNRYGSPYAPGPAYEEEEDYSWEVRRRHPRFGSPYAPGEHYDYEPDYERPDDFGRNRHGSPYAQGPAWDWEYRRRREKDYGRNRHGSPYAQGPAWDWEHRSDRPAGYGRERYGSPYAPGPAYGPYTGIGPRGYHRSDERIFEEVCERLMRHGGIDAQQIDVTVQDGDVILKGNVDSQWAKRAAEDTALSVMGVEDVQNELRVSWSGRYRGEYHGAPTGRETLETGMEVRGSDGKPAGKVAQVRSYDFLLERPDGSGIYVPLGACQKTNGQIQLDLPVDELEAQDWPRKEA